MALATTLSGCSLVFVTGPPEPVAGVPLPAGSNCTTNAIFPVADFIGATLGLLAAVRPDGVDGGWVVVAAFLGQSGVTGVSRVRRCREFLAIPYSDSTGVAPVAAPPNVAPVKGNARQPAVAIHPDRDALSRGRILQSWNERHRGFRVPASDGVPCSDE